MWRWLGYLIGKLWLALAGLLVLAALLLTLLRYALPHIPNLASHAETWLAMQYQIRADIGAIDAQWSAGGLRVILADVSLPPAANSPVDLRLGRLGFRLDLWRSVFNLELVVDDILLTQSELTLYPDRLRNDTAAANELDAVGNLLLSQLQQFDIRAGVLHIDSLERPRQTLLIDDLRWLNEGTNHRAKGTFRPSALTQNTLAVAIDARGDNWRQLVGDIHLVADNFDVSSWLTERLGQAQIHSANLNFSSWISFADGRLTQSTLALEQAQLSWQVATRRQQLQVADGLVQLRPTAAGWSLSSSEFRLQSAAQNFTLKPWQATISSAEQRVQVTDFPLAALVPHLPLIFASQALTTDQLKPLDELLALAPVGELDITLQRRGDDWRWWLVGQDLGWSSSPTVPALNGLALQAQGNLIHAKWQLSGSELALRSDWLDPLTAWDINQVDLRGGWFLGSQTQRWWMLPTSTVTVNEAVVQLQGQHLRTEASEPLTELSVSSRLPLAMLTVQRLLPAVMGENLQSYLQDALRGGALTAGQLLWRQQGAAPWLQVAARASALDFKFQPNWPALTEFNALLYANTERLFIATVDLPLLAEAEPLALNGNPNGMASIAGMQVTKAQAEITGLSGEVSPHLDIQAQVQGDAALAQPLFADSPLRDSVGEVLTTLQLKGPISAKLQLNIPLTEATSDEIRAAGQVAFQQTQLHIEPIQTDVVIERGQLAFANDKISATELTASWQGLPVTVALTGGSAALRSTAADDYLVDIRLNADWQTDAMYAAIPELPWRPYLYGAINWRSELQLQLPQQDDFQFSWQQEIDFTGLESSLPAPFKKEFGEAWEGRLHVTGGPTALHIGVDLPQRLLAQMQLSGDAQQLQHGFVQVGAEQPQQILPNARQFFINADLSNADVGLWYTVIADVLDSQAQSSTAEESSGMASFLPDLIQVRSPTLTWAGQTLTDTNIRAFPSPSGWQLELSAQQAAMDIVIPRTDAAIQIDAKFLELAPVESLRQTAAAAPDINLALLPAISFQCRRCQYGNYNLGEVAAEFAPRENGLDIKNVTLHKGANRLQLDGTWLRQPAADGELSSQTTIQGSMTSEDFGALLSEYEITTVVQDSSASLNFNLNWQGTPYEFNTESLSGRVEWVLGEGYLRDVSEGGARLLSILSIEGLLRKLTLDFRDIFSNGMFYTRFGGTLQLDQGVASTSDTRLLGSAGDMEIQGQTNLVTEAVDYRLVYVPKVTSSLPVILAWMVNPPSGLAALLIDKVLHDAQVISRLEYQVTGTMDDPEVTEVRRDSREVELPQPADTPNPQSPASGAQP